MKKTLYPKTERIGAGGALRITEKLDGSCLGIFKKDGELYVAQRNHVLKSSELTKETAYKGLRQWIKDNADELELIVEGACVFGEWIGMGQIGYGETDIDKRFYMFAKANINDDLDIYNLNYVHDYFQYSFGGELPSCIGVVPTVTTDSKQGVSVKALDELYEKYNSEKERNVEGFVIFANGGIKKYVRFKNGKPSSHVLTPQK